MQLRPRNVDPYFIPTAPGGLSGPQCPLPNMYFCWLNARDQQGFALALMHVPGRPGYRLVQGRNVEETRKLALALGLTEAHVDERTNRITWGGVDTLAMLPREEYETRMAEQRASALARQQEFKDGHPARIDAMQLRGVRGVVMQRGEFEERAAHAARPDRPVVSYAGLDPKAAQTSAPAPQHGFPPPAPMPGSGATEG